MDSHHMTQQPMSPTPNNSLTSKQSHGSAPALYAALLLGVFYVFSVVAIGVALGLAIVDFVLYILFGRFGIGLAFFNPFLAMVKIVATIVKNLFLQRGSEFGVPIARNEAPEFFQMVEKVARHADVQPPSRIYVQMHWAASVHPEGYFVRRGDYSLYLGYDMFAVLSECEMDAVISHELAHVKLCRHWLYRWLCNGAGRAFQITRGLGELGANAGKAKKRSHLAKMLSSTSGALARSISRYLSAYNRNDELAADRWAARRCGTECTRSSLTNVYLCDYIRQSIEWPDRILSMHREESFSKWLCSMLTPTKEDRERITKELLTGEHRGDFDTHPLLADRLSAIPEGFRSETSDRLAIDLLVDPDDIARRVLADVERIVTEDQRKDAEQQMKQAKSRISNISRGTLVLRFLGAVIACVGLFALWTSLTMDDPDKLSMCIVTFGVFAFGAGILYSTRARKMLPALVPSFSAWQKSFESELRTANDLGWYAAIKSELIAGVPDGMQAKQKLSNYWASQASQFLVQCDYQRALVAADLCVAADPKRLEGSVARAISQAYFRLDNVGTTSDSLLSKPGVASRIVFELGWLTALLERWDYAEGYFLRAAEQRPQDAVVYAMLAFCQWKRDKATAAAESIRKAVDLCPQEISYRQFLTKTLMDSLRLKDAEKELQELLSQAPDDQDTMMSAVRVSLMAGRAEEAIARAERMAAVSSEGRVLCQLAYLLLDFHHEDAAESVFRRVNDEKFRRDALQGIAYVEYDRGNHDRVRSLLKHSLDVNWEPVPDANALCRLLINACQMMQRFSGAAVDCKGWMAEVDMTDLPVAVNQFIFQVAAPSIDHARSIVVDLYCSMLPATEFRDEIVKWTMVDQKEQSNHPLTPGVYGVWWK